MKTKKEEDKIDLNNLTYKGLDLITEEVNEGERTIVFRITTPKQDVIGDVVETKGADLSYYRKHSVFLWAHDHTIPTLGRSLWIKKDPDNADIKIKVQFQDTTQFAKEIYELYRTKYLRGCSIGFRVKPGGIESLEGDDKASGGVRFTKWMLIEVSGCNCPAHPDAVAVAKSIVTTDRLKEELGFNDNEKTVGGKRGLPLASEDRRWDATRAERGVRNWAGGDKEDIDWSKYKQAFVWYNPEDSENFRAYKLPFAEIIDGSLKAVWRGIASAMGVLMGARGGVDIPGNERKPVYNFLVSYYKKFDKDPPEFKEYTEDEIEDLIAEYELEEEEFKPIDYDEGKEKTGTFKYCVCKKCNYSEEKKAGDPCQEKKCPECGEFLMGSNKKPKKTIDSNTETNASDVKELIEKLSVKIEETMTGLDARIKKIEEVLSEKEKEPEKPEVPKKPSKDVIEVISEEKKVKEEPKDESAIKETFTLKEAREIAEKAVKIVIDGALDYHLGESFTVKQTH